MADISLKVERKVAIVDENQTVLEAAAVMVERYIGSIVIGDHSAVRGIFTERDLMRLVAHQKNPAQTKLKDVMRTDLVRANPTDSVEQCLNLMRTHRCRHLLIYESGKFIGIVSLRDLASQMLEEKESLIRELTKYIAG
ncbi:MAG: CBS domain-containing protein [Gammaproteobacteria bacterium]|nr:CBS domain-containing protein [Gammaproteobacteria bacterium]